MKNKPYSVILWMLFTLFCLRVLVQLLQLFFELQLLPEFNEFQSGTVPYFDLFVNQILIIVLCLRACIRVSKGKTVFSRIKGKRYLFLGIFYASAMVLRYSVRMYLFPPERWMGGAIPPIFHLVLA